MSTIQEQIKKISKNLVKLAPKNEEKIIDSINSILSYMNLLNEIDTSNVSPTLSVISKKHNSFKIDEEKRNIEPIILLKCSKQKIIENQIVINNIMK